MLTNNNLPETAVVNGGASDFESDVVSSSMIDDDGDVSVERDIFLLWNTKQRGEHKRPTHIYTPMYTNDAAMRARFACVDRGLIQRS